MRKLIDSLFISILRLSVSYLYRYYDLFLDGVEVWISEKIPSFDDVLSNFDDKFSEE